MSAVKDETRNIVISFKNGDERAFSFIYNTFWAYLHTIAYQFTRSANTADDMVQEVFTDLWVHRHRVDENRPLKPYLRSIIRFKVISYLRRMSILQREGFLQRIKEEYYNNGAVNTTQESIDYNGLHEWFEHELEQLPIKSRQIFQMSRIENLSNTEIASHLNISVKNVEYHITKVLSVLKQSNIHNQVNLSCLTLFFLMQ